MKVKSERPDTHGWTKGMLSLLLLFPMFLLDAQIQPPTFTDCSDVEACSYGAKDDLIHVDLKTEVVNHCISNPGLYFTTQIDLFSDSTIDQTKSTLDASGEYPLGVHTITFWAADGCGGVSSCKRVVTVKDCKKPKPICNAVTIELMPSSGLAEIMAASLEVGNSFDNLTAYGDLKILVERLEKVAPGQNAPDADAAVSVVVTCDDLPPVTMNPVVEVAVWVGDEAGNWDYCVTTITVKDWLGACGCGPIPMLSCYITNEDLEPIELVTVECATPSNNNWTQITGNSGVISFMIFEAGVYTLTPEKDINLLNGVTTYDLILLQRHFLGIKPLTSPYKIIAADINNNCSLSIADLIELRRMILDPKNAAFKNNTSWRFVDANFIFPNPMKPCNFAETVSFNVISSIGFLGANFIGVKIGDISGDHTPNQLLEPESREVRGNLTFRVMDRLLESGQEYEIAISANDVADILGYQYTLEMDPGKVEFIDVTPRRAELDRSHFGLAMTSDGKLTTSWNGSGPTTLVEGAVLYTITLRALSSGWLSQALNLSSTVTPAEAYDQNEKLLDVQLHFDRGEINGGEFTLDQNKPNPFTNQTRIGFYLPEAGEATLTVYDVMGKVLYKSNASFEYGVNEFVLSRSELPEQGVLYYTVQYGGQVATKRMIVNQY
ncbi:MAG: T9SS type A sorting domain-containing protein [Saprospiraceae bacterium]|nr:T9SS type A sorting domain-containing protein [Saprospiraceae bacterium]